MLDVLLRLFGNQHTAGDKSVSDQTRQERDSCLQHFLRDLKLRAGFKTLPDPATWDRGMRMR